MDILRRKLALRQGILIVVLFAAAAFGVYLLARLGRAEVLLVSIAVAAALGLATALIFRWRFNAYVLTPISALTEKVKRIAEGDYDQYLEVRSRDEIGALAAEFNQMASRLRDVHKSDYWRLLLERKKSDAVINSIFEPVIVTDAGGNVTKINRAAVQLFGLNRSETEGEAKLSLASFE